MERDEIVSCEYLHGRLKKTNRPSEEIKKLKYYKINIQKSAVSLNTIIKQRRDIKYQSVQHNNNETVKYQGLTRQEFTRPLQKNI